MLRRQIEIRNQVQRLIDAALFALSFWLAYVVRSSLGSGTYPFSDFALRFFRFFGGTMDIGPFEKYLPTLLLTIPIALVLLQTRGFYNRPLLASRKQTAWQLLHVCALAAVAVVLIGFLVKVELARVVIILFGICSFVLMMAKEELVRRYVIHVVGHARLRKRIILIGTSEDTAQVRAQLESKSKHDMDVVAEMDVNETSVDELLDLVHEQSANSVALAAKHTMFGQIEKVIQACELEGVEVWLMADFFNTQISHTSVDEFYGRPMMVFRSTPEVSWQAVAKHTIDFIGALVLIVLLCPVLLFCVAAIRLTSPGPVLFRQTRSGLNGRPFTMYKFRTMVSDAEQRKHELEALNEMEGPVFKVADDPRITNIGRMLRRRSFDELPQLFNVLRGEMSLVGPRPLPVAETKQFDDLAHRRRLSVKPGLTCLWQVSGRNNLTDFKEWVRLDLEYIDNWSLWLDLKILWRTIPVVVLGTGAK